MEQYLHEVHGLVITSFKYMAIDQMKKQMSDGNSTCPLDPMDTRKTNGHFQVHLTNGMSNGFLIFPSDILHGYWTLINQSAQTGNTLKYCKHKPINVELHLYCILSLVYIVFFR